MTSMAEKLLLFLDSALAWWHMLNSPAGTESESSRAFYHYRGLLLTRESWSAVSVLLICWVLIKFKGWALWGSEIQKISVWRSRRQAEVSNPNLKKLWGLLPVGWRWSFQEFILSGNIGHGFVVSTYPNILWKLHAQSLSIPNCYAILQACFSPCGEWINHRVWWV